MLIMIFMAIVELALIIKAVNTMIGGTKVTIKMPKRMEVKLDSEQSEEEQSEEVTVGAVKKSEAVFQRIKLVKIISEAEFNEMKAYHEKAKADKIEHFRHMAMQEKIEHEFNNELTTIDDLEAYADSDDPRVIRDTVTFKNKEILVYRLRGFPMKFLSHMINYRERDTGWELGRELSDRLKDPSFWNKKLESEVQESGCQRGLEQLFIDE